MLGVSCLAEDLLASEEGLCPLELVYVMCRNERPLLFRITGDVLFVSGRELTYFLYT
jgi:hypothetical protein